jgi:hypothetical protein
MKSTYSYIFLNILIYQISLPKKFLHNIKLKKPINNHNKFNYNINNILKLNWIEEINNKYLNKNGWNMGLKFIFKDEIQTINLDKKNFLEINPGDKKTIDPIKIKADFIKSKFYKKFHSLSSDDQLKKDIVFDNEFIEELFKEIQQELEEKNENLDKELYDQCIIELFIIYNNFFPLNKDDKFEDVFEEFSSFLTDISDKEKENTKFDNIIHQRDDIYKYPWGRLYIGLELDREKFFKKISFLQVNIVLNLLFSFNFSFDPFFWFKNKSFGLRKDSLLFYFLTGLQMPEILTILPSNTRLYMKLFLNTGFLYEASHFRWMVGSSFMIGYKELGYLKMELINDINSGFKFPINIFKYILSIFNFLRNMFNEKKIPEFTFFQDLFKKIYENNNYNNISLISISFHKKTNPLESNLVLILKKNSNIAYEKSLRDAKHYREEKKKKFSKIKSIYID